MNKVTKAALGASIEKWKRNSVAESQDAYLIDVVNCPLCDLFFSYYCDGCPVKEKTGENSCYETPYIDASRAYTDWDDDNGKLARKLALEEVAFLESLQE